jgi:hypothetical protein
MVSYSEHGALACQSSDSWREIANSCAIRPVNLGFAIGSELGYYQQLSRFFLSLKP